VALDFGYRTGSVDLVDWDAAIIQQFGGLEDPTIKNQWYLPLQGIMVQVDGKPQPVDKALVVYKRPEPSQIEATLPMIALVRDSIVPAEARILTPVVSYRLPANGAQTVSAGGQLGFTNYDTKDKEEPYDIFYTIECWARYRVVAQILLQMIAATLPIRGTVTVVDSLNNERIYALYQQNLSDITELSSLVERAPGFSLSVRCEGELTLDRQQIIVPAFTGTITKTPLPNAGFTTVPGPDGLGQVPADANGLPLIATGGTMTTGNPDPGPGGVYGTGLPIIRQGITEDI
jgi:hypothetical protein